MEPLDEAPHLGFQLEEPHLLMRLLQTVDEGPTTLASAHTFEKKKTSRAHDEARLCQGGLKRW